MADYLAMTENDLKMLLQKRNLKTNGGKDVLIARLQQNDVIRAFHDQDKTKEVVIEFCKRRKECATLGLASRFVVPTLPDQ